MPFDWEADQFSQQWQDIEEMVEQTPPSLNTEEEIDEVMSEAEKRFEVAQYYKLLLRDNLFQNQTEASEKVEQEIRAFIKERLSVLLGVKAAHNTTSAFTPEQVQVLEQFANLGEEAPKMIESLMGRIAKKMVKPPKPVKEEPAIRTVKEPAKPALRKVEEPRLRGAPAKPETQPQQAPKPRGRRPKILDSIDPKYKDDPTLMVDGNKVFVQNRTPAGELLWEKIDGVVRPVYKDITPVAKPVGSNQPLPMPDDRALESITERQAEKQISSSLQGGNNLIVQQLKGQ